MDIARFLLICTADDLRAAVSEATKRIDIDEDASGGPGWREADCTCGWRTSGYETVVEEDAYDHALEKHVPAFVRADIESKRQVVKLHEGQHECVGDRHGHIDTVLVAPGYVHEVCPTLRLLALPYADRPDYDPVWALTQPPAAAAR
jgi:uncharacterized protein DUF6221